MFIIKKDISVEEKCNFNKRFCIDEFGYDRSIRENIWRRHQCEENKENSRWASEKDKRIKLIHFIDEYSLNNNDFCLNSFYLSFIINLPQKESDIYIDNFKPHINFNFLYNYNILENNNNYQLVNFILKSKNFNTTKEIENRPFKIFNYGIRKKQKRGYPKYIKSIEIDKFFPAHIEMGCGPSIEANIPPLNFFHDLYSLHDKEKKFIFNYDNNIFFKKMQDTENWYKNSSLIHKLSLTASPTIFYHWIKEKILKGDIIAPIFTNNFDGLARSLDVSEFSLRQFDKIGEYPKYSFAKDAKSLIVVGSHADRRECQKQAREIGLPIIYIDPEGYDNNQYLIEAPQNNDFIIKLKSTEFVKEYERNFKL